MTIDRRHFLLSAGALTLSACGGGVTSTPTPRATTAYRTVPNAGYAAWVAGFKTRAAGQGISQATLASAFRGAGYIPEVIKKDRNQTEFKRSLEDYLAIATSDERIAKGKAAMARYGSQLAAIEGRYGVSRYIVAAVWGLESFYGERKGDVPVISATSTLAYEGRRGAFFEKQLVAALKILQNGDITASRMTGSWAGAMGHTQFIPTSYQAFAVDFTGDGRRDIWSADPSDALASTAAYLKRNGWKTGVSWGGEGAGGRKLQPQPGGPVFGVSHNFNVIKRYNNSDSYAIGVGHLSDRLAGKGPLRGSFPPDANGLTLKTRKELQRRLTSKGFDTQGADGVIGNNTRTAIEAYQRSVGLPVTGEPSLDLLQRLR